jgi:hypothetical protein
MARANWSRACLHRTTLSSVRKTQAESSILRLLVTAASAVPPAKQKEVSNTTKPTPCLAPATVTSSGRSMGRLDGASSSLSRSRSSWLPVLDTGFGRTGPASLARLGLVNNVSPPSPLADALSAMLMDKQRHSMAKHYTSNTPFWSSLVLWLLHRLYHFSLLPSGAQL